MSNHIESLEDDNVEVQVNFLTDWGNINEIPSHTKTLSKHSDKVQRD